MISSPTSTSSSSPHSSGRGSPPLLPLPLPPSPAAAPAATQRRAAGCGAAARPRAGCRQAQQRWLGHGAAPSLAGCLWGVQRRQARKLNGVRRVKRAAARDTDQAQLLSAAAQPTATLLPPATTLAAPLTSQQPAAGVQAAWRAPGTAASAAFPLPGHAARHMDGERVSMMALVRCEWLLAAGGCRVLSSGRASAAAIWCRLAALGGGAAQRPFERRMLQSLTVAHVPAHNTPGCFCTL